MRFTKLCDSAKKPTYGSEFSAGADLYSCSTEPIAVAPGETVFVHTGIAVEIPNGYVGLVFARSGLASKRGLAPANKVGVIDSDYRGEIMVALHNQSQQTQTLDPQERIAQLVITPYVHVEYEETSSLSDTERGTGGFGSTGRV